MRTDSLLESTSSGHLRKCTSNHFHFNCTLQHPQFPHVGCMMYIDNKKPTHQLHSLILTAKHDEWHWAAVLQGMDTVGATETHRNTDEH